MDYYDYLNGIDSNCRMVGIHSQMHGLIDAITEDKLDRTIEDLADNLSMRLLLSEQEVGHEYIKPYKDLFTKIISAYRLKHYRDGGV